MNLDCNHYTITQNDDSTFKVELNGVKFKDANGEELEGGVIIFPRVSKQGVDSFKNENVMPGSEIFIVDIVSMKNRKEVYD